jgi:protein gp37
VAKVIAYSYRRNPEMSDNSKIEWTDATWNPVTGCTKVSPGCDHCYAETFAERFRGVPGHHFENGFDVQLRPDKLDQPLRWKRPRRVFVNSMSDLFHADVPEAYIAGVFAVMARAPQHTFQILTKRPGRMRSLMRSGDFQTRVLAHDVERWPLPNVWLGVSAEDQRWADIRIPVLLDSPAAVRFVSAEPLLDAMDLQPYLHEVEHIDWLIVGGESGRGARPMDLEWVRNLRDQCEESPTAFFYKQQGSGDGGPKSRRELDGRTWDDEPALAGAR